MASGTPTTNLGLRTMTDADSVDAQDINYNSGILDTKIGAVGSTSLQSQVTTLNSKIAHVEISNQYSTVLAAINAYRNQKSMPFTIRKTANSATTDLPSGVSDTCEWTVICYGSPERLTAQLTVFTGGSSNNGSTYTANIFNGEYIFTWDKLALKSDTVYVPNVLTFDSSNVTQTATLSDYKNHAIIGFTVNDGAVSIAVTGYLTELSINTGTGTVTVTRTGTGVWSGAKLGLILKKIN